MATALAFATAAAAAERAGPSWNEALLCRWEVLQVALRVVPRTLPLLALLWRQLHSIEQLESERNFRMSTKYDDDEQAAKCLLSCTLVFPQE